MTDSVISAVAIGKHFESVGETVIALDRLSFRLDCAGSLALVGRSGSGKSTLLNILCGLQSADSGTLDLLGQTFVFRNAAQQASDNDRRWAALRRRRIGVVFQETNLMPAMTLLENVQLRASLAGVNRDRSQQWLDRLGVGELASRFPDQVSGGQCQRAAVAMTFAMEPALILADEPTGSLDRHTADTVADLMFAVQREQGCALVLATHDHQLADRCDRLIDLGSAG